MLNLFALAAALVISIVADGQAQTNAAPRNEPSASGSSARPVRLTPAEVKEALEQQGFTQVEVLQETRTGFSAKAMKGGKSVSLATDPKGAVMPGN